MLEVFKNPALLTYTEQVIFDGRKFDIVDYADDYFTYDTGTSMERFHYSDLFYIFEMCGFYISVVYSNSSWQVTVECDDPFLFIPKRFKNRHEAEREAIRICSTKIK